MRRARHGAPDQDLRHDAPGRHPGRGRVLLHGGQGAPGPAAGRAGRPLHRGRLAGLEPEGHAVLPPDPRRAAQARAGGGVRRDPAGRRRRRGGPEPPGPRRGAHPGGDDLRKVLALPRHARPPDDPAREPPDDPGLGGVPRPARRGGRVRRRALLRRVQARPRLCAGDPARGRARRRPLPRALRHQRRHAPLGGGRDRARDAAACPDAARDPRPQRRGVRRRELAGRGRRGRGARPGDAQRVRGALRERQPGVGHPERHAEARARGDPGGPPSRAARRRAVRLRAGEPDALAEPAVRGRLGVRPQGRDARVGGPQASRDLRAHHARPRGEPPASARVRARGARRTSSGRRASTGSTWTRTRRRRAGSSRPSSGSRTRGTSSRGPRPRSSS